MDQHTAFQIKTEQFSGPLGKLLELIEARELDITRVALADVTEDFIAYIKTLGEQADARVLSDFVVVAARLMLIKSKILLPDLELTGEEESQIHDLELRLELYREYKAAGILLGKRFGNAGISFSRDLFAHAPSFFYPSKNLTAPALHGAIARVFTTLETFLPKDERTIARVLVTIEQKMSELMARMSAAVSHSFKNMAKDKSKGEIVVLFLAILHLLKQQQVSIEQGGAFDDIIIKKS